VGTKVISEYMGAGDLALAAQEFESEIRCNKKSQQHLEKSLGLSHRKPEIERYFKRVTVWLMQEMASRGFKRHRRGEWRKMSAKELAERRTPTTKVTDAMARRAMVKAYSQNPEEEVAKRLLNDIDLRIEELLFDGDSSIERVLAERIAMAEVHVNFLQNAMFATKSFVVTRHIDRELNSANNRLLQAVRSLASIRRLPNLTLVQIRSERDEI
jgi:hypothetical protein